MRISCKKLVSAFKERAVTAVFALACLVPASTIAQQTASPTEHSRWRARITEIKTVANAPASIPILKWTPIDIWVDGLGPVQYARIRWQITTPFKIVTINGKQLNPKSDSTFDVNFGFTNSEKAFKITVQDVAGKTFEGSYKIIPIDTGKNGAVAASRYRFSVGIGYTSISYSQTNVDSFSESTVTVKGGVSYRLVPDRFDLSLTTFLNAFTLSSTSAAGYTVRYLGVNARVGYHVIRAPSPFRLVINGGLYYNTSFGSIGFSNMYGPQLYPEVSYILPNGHAILAYGKFSPALFQQKIDFSRNREVAAGLYYLFPLNAKFRMAVGVDFSKLDLATDTDAASTSTFSVSTGLSF